MNFQPLAVCSPPDVEKAFKIRGARRVLTIHSIPRFVTPFETFLSASVCSHLRAGVNSTTEQKRVQKLTSVINVLWFYIAMTLVSSSADTISPLATIVDLNVPQPRRLSSTET